MTTAGQSVSGHLNRLLIESSLDPLDSETSGRFAAYCALLLRWNAKMNLTAVRDEASILSRHFVESIACARALPPKVRTLLDFGAGAGFPGIPISLCRPEIAVTLAESQGKKAAFLREAVRTLGISAEVHGDRAETLSVNFDCVALRAVDRMQRAVLAARDLVRSGGWLAIMTTEGELKSVRLTAGAGFLWREPIFLPGSNVRLLALARKEISLPA